MPCRCPATEYETQGGPPTATSIAVESRHAPCRLMSPKFVMPGNFCFSNSQQNGAISLNPTVLNPSGFNATLAASIPEKHENNFKLNKPY